MDGVRKGWSRALMTVLAAKGIEVPDHIRARIDACTELGYFEIWMERAARAEAEGIEDVIG